MCTPPAPSSNKHFVIIFLHSAEFLGWIDRGYPPPTDANTVTLIVQKGGSVILECSPNTTESLKGRIPQLEAKIATLSLPSGNVLVPDVQEDVSISCVWPLQEAHTRHFHISVSPGEWLYCGTLPIIHPGAFPMYRGHPFLSPTTKVYSAQPIVLASLFGL